MSNGQLRRSRGPKHLCQRCRDRKARFRYRGAVRADRDHTLCFECFRREVNQARARRLARRSRLTPSVSSIGPAGTLSQAG